MNRDIAEDGEHDIEVNLLRFASWFRVTRRKTFLAMVQYFFSVLKCVLLVPPTNKFSSLLIGLNASRGINAGDELQMTDIYPLLEIIKGHKNYSFSSKIT